VTSHAHAIKRARAQVARRLNLHQIATDALRQGCRYLEISDKGDRKEIIERYASEIWEAKYNMELDDDKTN